MSDRNAAVLRRLTPRLDGMLVQLSIEMVEMNRGSYTRQRLGGVVGWERTICSGYFSSTNV